MSKNKWNMMGGESAGSNENAAGNNANTAAGNGKWKSLFEEHNNKGE